MIFLGHYIRTRNYSLIYFLILCLIFLQACNIKKQNKLANATSLYLQQNADSPVNWYEWGEEALSIAKKANKPLLISIGYASCHWCHQMAKETFMDTAVANFMNRNFVCIKVDREQRPDLDKIYMNACELVSSNSGWPLNAFALPDGKPFYAVTYHTKESWLNLLKQIVTAYNKQYKKVVLQANALSQGIAQLEFSALSPGVTTDSNKTKYEQLFENVYHEIDLRFGGLKGSPKFPSAPLIEFLLQNYFITKDKRSLDAAITTLTNMAIGGIYDQLGGGFARYSTDSLWHIPHFEKMLYDNAQLISAYAHAYQITGNELFRRVTKETIDFINRDLSNGEGGYFSSVNADQGDEEGGFYAWTSAALTTALPETNDKISNYFHVTKTGNWKPGLNILYSTETPVAYARNHQIDSNLFSAQLTNAKSVLLTIRNKRDKPAIDDKVLTSWNALILQSLLDAYAALGEKRYLQYALSCAHFIDKMLDNDGRLWRCYRKGIWSIEAFLDDYAFLSKAYLRLYQLTFDKYWLVRSQQMIGYATKNFYDVKEGMFYYTSIHSDSALVRKLEIADNGLPSSNAVMAEVLYTLGVYFDNEDYQEKAKRMLSRLSKQLYEGETKYYSSWCYLPRFFSMSTNEVEIIGENALDINIAMQKNFLPLSIFMGSIGEENLPGLEGKNKKGQTFIYICTKGVCKKPVQDVGLAMGLLVNSNNMYQSKIRK